MRLPTTTLLPLLAALVLSSLGFPAGAQVFPVKPTPHEDTWYVLTFRCPYPSVHRNPVVTRSGSRIVIEAVTEGSVCFTGNDTEVAFAVNLGRLPAGNYDVTFNLGFELSPNGTVVPFGGEPQQRRIRVRDHTPVRVSGLWHEPAAPAQGMNFLLAPNGNLVLTWFTYVGNGQAVWLFGQTDAEGLQASFDVALPSGGRFSRPFGNPELNTLGTLDIEFTSCGRAQAVWQSSHPAFPSRTLNLEQVASGDGLGGCEPDAVLNWRGWR
ncbi:MAG TPA: hypothetical protein PKZ76_18355 [Xanthomonadaceae bacterium]|nr:hypothetical protein [Xanthomonadaceae bacterium]